ncbi:MAG TPA: hypothetical protein VIU64_20460 [Polyangia bacterium]
MAGTAETALFSSQPEPALAVVVRRDRAVSPGGTTDARRTLIMKDLLFVAVAGGFFIVTWLYARSFDRI